MKIVASIVGALVAAVALAATSLASEGDGGNRADRLFGGGRFHFDFDPGPGEFVLPRDISVYATGHGKSGVGTRNYGNPNGPQPVVSGVLSCVRVEGNRAVVGTGSTPGGVLASVQYFEDNGPPGPDPADRITPVFGLSPESVEQFLPRRFPHACPSATPLAELGDAVWVPLDFGDIAVVEGRDGDDEDDD
jgi:hypothetical protein